MPQKQRRRHHEMPIGAVPPGQTTGAVPPGTGLHMENTRVAQRSPFPPINIHRPTEKYPMTTIYLCKSAGVCDMHSVRMLCTCKGHPQEQIATAWQTSTSIPNASPTGRGDTSTLVPFCDRARGPTGFAHMCLPELDSKSSPISARMATTPHNGHY